MSDSARGLARDVVRTALPCASMGPATRTTAGQRTVAPSTAAAAVGGGEALRAVAVAVVAATVAAAALHREAAGLRSHLQWAGGVCAHQAFHRGR